MQLEGIAFPTKQLPRGQYKILRYESILQKELTNDAFNPYIIILYS